MIDFDDSESLELLFDVILETGLCVSDGGTSSLLDFSWAEFGIGCIMIG